MKSFFSLLLIRLGLSGDPDTLCISALPPWPLLFVTGAFLLLAGSILVRSLVDIAFPQTIVQRLSGSRSVTQWSITATLVFALAAAIEAMGGQMRMAISDTMHNMASLDHPMAVTGLSALAAGLLVTMRAMVLMQLAMFQRAHASAGPSGLPTDGAYAQTGGLSFGAAAGSLVRKPGGGVPAMLLGVILAAYGFELLRQADLCL